MNNNNFKEIIVFKDFEVENSVLGLEWDIYLSIVKFLDPLILRKVWVNIIFFNISFVFFIVKNYILE
jgi:hypothetical protein